MIERLTAQDFEEDWAMFNARAKGDHVGPMMGKTIDESLRAWAEYRTQHVTVSDQMALSETKEREIAEKQVNEEETDANKGKNDSVKDGGDVNKSETKFIEKPDTASVLLCPMPLPPDTDPLKKQDALSLRVMPLSTILSYTTDDCSERIFEASIAAEIFKSCIAMNYANLIVDFVLAMTGNMTSLADQR